MTDKNGRELETGMRVLLPSGLFGKVQGKFAGDWAAVEYEAGTPYWQPNSAKGEASTSTEARSVCIRPHLLVRI